MQLLLRLLRLSGESDGQQCAEAGLMACRRKRECSAGKAPVVRHCKPGGAVGQPTLVGTQGGLAVLREYEGGRRDVKD